MKTNKGISPGTAFAVAFLIVAVIGLCYYIFFYKPFKAELADIEAQKLAYEDDINVSMAKVSQMASMQEELDEILSRPKDEITEIAPYDNAKVVMTQLNGILRNSVEYDLSFKDPDIQSDGTVRRVVSMKFSCADYNSARAIIDALQASHWRCLINSINLAADEDQIELIDAMEQAALEAEEAAKAAAEAAAEAGEAEAPAADKLVEKADKAEEPEEEEEPQAMSIIGSVTVSATITFFESQNIE